jgi:hypothetical protein
LVSFFSISLFLNFSFCCFPFLTFSFSPFLRLPTFFYFRLLFSSSFLNYFIICLAHLVLYFSPFSLSLSLLIFLPFSLSFTFSFPFYSVFYSIFFLTSFIRFFLALSFIFMPLFPCFPSFLFSFQSSPFILYSLFVSVSLVKIKLPHKFANDVMSFAISSEDNLCQT